MEIFRFRWISGSIGTLLTAWEIQRAGGIVACSKPVVDAFDPRLLVAPAISHVIDFSTVKEEDLYEINIPLKFTGTRIHGLACWFDVLFNGSTVQRWLTTAPGAPTTHWYQLRCVLSQPIYVMPGQEITGHLHMIAHSAQSYTINLTMS
ncbi:probable histone-arginine methyltransferase 1.3, partial [Tanacetum coccineum]